jgi:hypothetical protein
MAEENPVSLCLTCRWRDSCDLPAIVILVCPKYEYLEGSDEETEEILRQIRETPGG